MDTTALLETLAAAGLPDDRYTDAVTAIRALDVRARAGRRLAEVALEHEHYLPSRVMSAVGGVIAADCASVA